MIPKIIAPLVPIPKEKGVFTKVAGKKREVYVYKYIEYSRNEKGQAKNKAKTIGKLADEPEMMIPNKNYFELFNVTPVVTHHSSIMDYGYTYVAWKAFNDLGITDIIEDVFGPDSGSILAMAIYILREGNAMDGMEDWQPRNYLPFCDRLITSQQASRIFASINYAQRTEFFKKWIPTMLTDGSVCYDVTSISSYAQNMVSVERGYNRDNEDLPQFNLGMFCDEQSRLPIYYERYNGSLTDNSNLAYVLANAANIGIPKVKMVLDGGFWSKECVQSLADVCGIFTIGMPAHLNEAKAAIDCCRGDIQHYRNMIDAYHIYCVEQPATVHGITGKILVFFDPEVMAFFAKSSLRALPG